MTKYHSRATVYAGTRYASKAEARRAFELRALLAANEIRELEEQPRFPLLVNGVKVGTYVADFRYWDLAVGAYAVEDVKGVRTPVFKLKAKLMKAIYGIEVREIEA